MHTIVLNFLNLRIVKLDFNELKSNQVFTRFILTFTKYVFLMHVYVMVLIFLNEIWCCFYGKKMFFWKIFRDA